MFREMFNEYIYLGEWSKSRENARASGEAARGRAQIGELARRLKQVFLEWQVFVLLVTAQKIKGCIYKIRKLTRYHLTEKRLDFGTHQSMSYFTFARVEI